MKSLQAFRLSIAVILLTTIATHVQSQSNYSISFDGVDDAVTMPHHAAFNVTDFTFEAWIKLNTTATNYTILSKGDGANLALTNYIFNVGGNSSNARLGLMAGGAYYSGNTTMITGRWYHVAVTLQGTSINFYLNGVNDGSATLASAIYTGGSYNFRAGVQGDVCSCNQMNGELEEIRVWNVARTVTEIKANLLPRNLAPNAPGLVAHYSFNEGSGTSTVNTGTNFSGIDGTLSGSPVWAASPVQFSGNALAFNGSNNYIELNNRIALGTSNFTIEAWVYPQSTSAGMVFAQDVCGDAEHQFRLYTNNSRVNFDMSDASALGVPYNFQLPSTANSVPLNTWTHVAAVRNGNTYSVYINGVFNASFSTGANTINNTSGADVNKRLRIGARGGVSGGCGLNYFNGRLDEIRFWSVARTDSEIQQNYLMELDPSLQTNLANYYTFDQGIASGTNTGLVTLIDQKGNNNGTLLNFGLSGASSNFIAQNNNVGTLPLNWVAFTARKQQQEVKLNWTTSDEVNTSHFIIQHRQNTGSWQNTGRVTALGSQQLNHYQFTHVPGMNTKNYYRILQVDLDGRSTTSETKFVRMEHLKGNFRVLGNPVAGQILQVEILQNTGTYLSLYSAEGRQLWTRNLNPGLHQIPINYPPGLYILRNDSGSEKIVMGNH